MVNERTACPYCSYPVAEEHVTMWDGRPYCRKCVEEVSPSLLRFYSEGKKLQDILDRSDISVLNYLNYIGKLYLLSVIMIFGLPGVLLVLLGKIELRGLLFVLGIFGVGGTVFMALQAILGAWLQRFHLPEEVRIENGFFLITSRKKQESVPLKDCKWYYGSTSADQTSHTTTLRKGVVIQTPDTKLAVGYDRDVLDHWRAFLTLTRLPQNPPPKYFRLTFLGLVGAAIGLVIGCSVGYLVDSITNENIWGPALGFLGLVDGAAAVVLYDTCTSEGIKAAKARTHPALLGLMFFALGVKLGPDLPSAFVCASVNSALGITLGWLCRMRIHAAQMDEEFTTQLPH